MHKGKVLKMTLVNLGPKQGIENNLGAHMESIEDTSGAL